jgi:amino acid adenylation domain-containing protein
MQLPAEQEAIRAKCVHPSGTFVEFPVGDVETSIPARFEKIVRRYPDRLAVKMAERTVTYDELNKWANQIARAILARRGQGSEPIALLFEHGIEVFAAMIGVLKAGKFYIAVDRDSPEERVARVLKNSGVQLIVTNSQDRIPGQSIDGGALGLLTTDEIDVSSRSSENLDIPIASSDVSGIVYTSGTTGEPKGAIETHGYRLHVMRGHSNLVHVCPEDRLSLVHSVSFGGGLIQVFRSLLNGASLFPFDLKSRGIAQFTKWVNQERISIAQLPPSAIRQLADLPDSKELLKSLRVIHLSGSPITKYDFDLYKEHFPATTFLAITMGATGGGTICSCILDKSFTFPAEGTPVGFPVEGNEILLVDEHRNEVGMDREGEIAVRSRYLGAGYWGQPEVSKAHFVSDRGSERPIYLTGDLGRRLPNGFLVHLGRNDLMIKIRGFRVEFGEVESALLKHPEVRAAGVRAWDRESGEKYLAAYVAPRASTTPTAAELREFLKHALSDYMIPSKFVFMNDLPLTNGKLDRAALPKPGSERPEMKTPFVLARNEVERTLVHIWEQVLDVRPIGIHDNFFELGGHSLAATQVVSRVIEQCRLEIPLRPLFESPTIADMATVIAAIRGKILDEQGLRKLLDQLESLSEEEARRLVTEARSTVDPPYDSVCITQWSSLSIHA